MAESDATSPTLTQRANALRKAMEEVKGIRAERQVPALAKGYEILENPVTVGIFLSLEEGPSL